MDSTGNVVKDGYGNSGFTSLNYTLIQYLSIHNEFSELKQLLDSKIPFTKYAASLSLLIAEDLKLIILDSNTRIKIEQIKLLNDSFRLLSGCTVRYFIYLKSELSKPLKGKHHKQPYLSYVLYYNYKKRQYVTD